MFTVESTTHKMRTMVSLMKAVDQEGMKVFSKLQDLQSSSDSKPELLLQRRGDPPPPPSWALVLLRRGNPPQGLRGLLLLRLGGGGGRLDARCGCVLAVTTGN